MCCVFADQNTQHTWLKFRCKSHLTWKHYVSFCNSKIGQTKLVQPVLVQIKMFRFYNRATSKPVHNNVKKNQRKFLWRWKALESSNKLRSKRSSVLHFMGVCEREKGPPNWKHGPTDQLHLCSYHYKNRWKERDWVDWV